ncbi:acetyl/propionyl/methylcrotonyl-CoA carboxylase subunit alpha [Variovorax saccharolyticus]|uniref:acetyl/propionyl/methylcrotonyl-CoA carboxylase subunit alpha n=1 Tax=Variovorax saccharolyticus TaxID=3053516 RepID=UPI0025763A0F|nr:biotin carboxylase N-terminal domain-containing protein [Variovorax sp. J22R187]MDM0018472.1 biotin carboxylase N-terminal domain-containing protein [Variovorax sp. J22R187]
MTTRKQIRPFHTVLVANRGEIAIRILRTVRRMGYGTVAVYSEADRDSPHVRAADRAVLIGGAAPRDSYLDIAALIEAARRAGADAVHPGYGFLAENADFADAVDAAGLVFIGPSGEAIRAMGNKAQAKRLVMSAGMPCIPGYQGEDQSDEAFVHAAADIGFPVMVKAAAGGGGRGMRLVHEAAALTQALASARSEAEVAFGSGELILERAVVAPRHVEIQLLADSHGHVIHLGERDCSVQRRHQKVIEEAPSPAVDAELRARMGDAAVKSARAIGYIGAGTMEFLLDGEGRADAGPPQGGTTTSGGSDPRSGGARGPQFYFMEMNTRLQVEHAVTEAITGLDLVEWQLRVAAGEPLTLQQSELRLDGHAIEVRLTAEDVPAGFLPQTGPVLRWRPPVDGHDVRVDHGLVEGGEVSPHYDSMIAKLVAHGATRDEARRKLLRAIEHCVLLGLPSNQGFLADCLADAVFAEGTAVHTGFVQERFGTQLSERAVPGIRTIALAAFGALASKMPAQDVRQPIVASALGQRAARVTLAQGSARWEVRLQAQGAQWQATVRRIDAPADAAAHTLALRDARWNDAERTAFSAECDGMVESAVLALQADAVQLFHAGRAWSFERVSERKSRVAAGGGGAVTAPLTGRIVDVAVREGETVQAGQRLVVLEAMKMEHTLTAPIAGVVAEVCVQAEGQSSKGALLLRIEEAKA